jgi:hypothetical protein
MRNDIFFNTHIEMYNANYFLYFQIKLKQIN